MTRRDQHGTFVMSRGWFDHPAFAPEPYTEREAWAWLISEAEWKPQKRKAGRMIVEVQRGSCTHSLRFLARKWRWHYLMVRRFLNKLAAENMIETTNVTGQNVITIVNYGTYQNVAGASETAPVKKRNKLNSGIDPPKEGGSTRAGARARSRARPPLQNSGKNSHEADRSITAAADWLLARLRAGEPLEIDSSLRGRESANAVRLLPEK